MQKIMECIPNFSEGRDKNKINFIRDAIANVPGILLLDVESDIAHNRSVITFAGEPEAVTEAAFQGTKKAAKLIDLNKHHGEHPRMGATDVIPFVPIKGITDKECIEYAKKLGARIGNELKIPVYLYEKAATKPERQNLANIRHGEYEGIKQEIGKKPERDPDFGPKKLGPAGAVAVGVRAPLIAFNVNLASNDLSLAKAIAKKIRFKDGGFKCVKALGFELKDRGIVQVSMNLTDFKETNVQVVFNAIKKEAKKCGVEILESEIIGLIPEESLIEASKYYLKISPAFKHDQILEQSLANNPPQAGRPTLPSFLVHPSSVLPFLDSIASKNPTPGGGSVAALTGALAAALVSMVANLTLASQKYAKVHNEIKKILAKSEKLRQELYDLIEKDAQSYNKVIQAYKTKNQNLIQKALKEAALTPLKTAQTAAKLLGLIKIVTKKGNKNASSDCGVALHLAKATIKSALLNVNINLSLITDKKFKTRIKTSFPRM